MNILGGRLQMDAGQISDAHVNSAAGITVDKQHHAYMPGTSFGFVIGGTPTTREEIVHVAAAAGVIRSFSALLNDTGTNTSITFDLKKNGVSVLSAVVTITHGQTDREIVAGTITTTTFAAGDVLSIAMTVTSSTGAQGPRAWAGISESAAP